MALIFHGVPKVNSSCLKLLPITNGCWLDARLLNQWEHYPTERALLQIVGGDKLIIPFC